MSDGIWAAASGAVAELATLDSAANNVANASTPGYKAQLPLFKTYLANASGQLGDNRLVSTDTIATDTTQGGFESTGRPTDAAIQGAGYFAIQGDKGVEYTRACSTRVGADGSLVNASGAQFLNAGGKPILVGANTTNVAIGADGSVMAGGVKVGDLGVFTFAKPEALERSAAQNFRATAASGEATKTDPKLETSSLEESNVSPVRGMVQIVEATRAFEACEKAIQAFKDADSKAASSLMRTS